ncbi:unnamed protein product [Amoebophrya sp. A25]|nr:unnamed protein product [Amoebophrya sp. A25]|eukprot:GSA25T00013223001.1
MLQLLEEAVVLERRSPGQLRSVVVVSTAYVLPYREPASSRHASTTVEQNENDKPHREEVQASSTPASTFSGAARPSSCALADERKQDALVADEDGGRGISPTKTRPRRTGDCSINSQPKKSTFTADHQSQPSTQRVSNLVSVGGAASSSSSSSSSCSRGNVRSPDITRGSTFLIPPLPTACGSKGVDNPFLIPPLPTARGSKGVDMLWLYEEVLHGRLTLATVRKHRWLHPQSTENAYIFSKTLAEHIIVDRFAKDLPLTFLRPSIISCSVDGEMGSRAAPFCGLKLLAHAGLLPRFWGGRGTLDTVHVDEVARRVAELTESVPPEKRKTTGTADITREQSRSGGQKGHPRMYFATSGSGITPRELREILQPRNRVWVLDSSSTSSTSATTSRSSSCSQKKKTHETVVTGKADTERASFDQACEQKHLKKNFLAGFISSWHPAPWASATITTMLSQISGKNATKTSSHNFFFSTKNMCLQQLVSCASSWFSVLWLLRAVECFVCWCFYGSKYATKLHQTYRNYDSFTLRDFDFPHTLPVEKRQLQKSLDVFANRFFKERENKQKSTRMKQEDTTDEERMKE